MNEFLYVGLALGVGALLGVFFFGGLWWTVKKGVTFARPAIFFIASMIIRTGIVLIGFYFVSCGHWERFWGCLAGFIIARIIVMHLTKLPIEKLKQ